MSCRSRGGATCVVALLLFLVSAAPVGAQGNGHGNAYGHVNKNVNSSAASGVAAATSEEGSIAGTGFRNFGSWLDDATVMDPGAGYVTLGLSYWRTPAFSEFDFPVMDGGIALNRRVQFGMSAPIYHAHEPGAPVVRGLGDVFLSMKVQLREPSPQRAGFAVTPVLEVLSAPLPDGGGRVHFGIPVSMELQRDGWRAYGSAGYFSRGAVFASAAIEVAVAENAWVTGTISQSHSMKSDDLSFALGLSKNRTDVSGGVAVRVHPRAAVFGSVGRSISPDEVSTDPLMFTTGVSLNFARK